MLKEKYLIEEFYELLTIFEENAQKQLKSYVHANRLFISDEDGEVAVDFMMRYSKNDTLVIVKFSVEVKRKGTGSKVLNWCVDFAKKENFKNIKIESVLTESMEKFCMKHQFTKDQTADDFYENLNWIKSV